MSEEVTEYLCEYSTPRGERSVTIPVASDEIVDYQDGCLIIRRVLRTGTSIVRVYDRVFSFAPIRRFTKDATQSMKNLADSLAGDSGRPSNMNVGLLLTNEETQAWEAAGRPSPIQAWIDKYRGETRAE